MKADVRQDEAEAAERAKAATEAVLALAQKLHDEYVAEGQETRERLISEGQSRHDQGTRGGCADLAQTWFSSFRSGIALRARAEAAQTWPKHGFRRPGSGFRYRDGVNYRTCR